MVDSSASLTLALALPSGAAFHRCALQVNPHHYGGTYRGQPNDGDEESFAARLIARACELDITVLGVTDHNSVVGITAIRNAAKGTGVTIFPGFELTSSDGVHVVCLYDPSTELAQLERYLGEFGLRSVTPSSALCRLPVGDVLARVHEQGGIAVAAHVTGNNGLLRALAGQACIAAWRHEQLLAIQIPGSIDDLPLADKKIIENRNPDYARARAVSEHLAVAVVNARDVTQPDELADPGASCWIKMSRIDIDGLRQAFLDPGSRIQLAGDREVSEHCTLVAMTWEGGFLDGAALHFNPNLNVLVGGRGTGKSTVIESIRALLGRESLGEDAARSHRDIVKYVLKAGTKISLLVRTSRPVAREYRIERVLPNPPIVREHDTGEISNRRPDELLPGIEVYGQHELAELTKSPEKLTRLLERFVERDPDAARKKADLRRELEKSRQRVLDIRRELLEVDERLAGLPRLEETLRQFEKAGLEERLREQSLLLREERVLEAVDERVEQIGAALDSVASAASVDRAFLSSKALEDLPGAPLLAQADVILEHLATDATSAVAMLISALRRAQEGIHGLKLQWNERQREVLEKYESILRDLQRSRVDGEEFMRLRRQIESLRPLRERRALLEATHEEHLLRRRDLLVAWEQIKAEEGQRLQRSARTVARRLENRVKVAVTLASDRSGLASVLREIGGRLQEAIEQLERRDELSLTHLVQNMREGADALGQAYGFSRAQAERLANASEEFRLRIEELEFPPMARIELNVASAGEAPQWRSLEQLSKGQKATAVLFMLLLESDAPLVVDQPEDDLDNRFIADGIVPRIREQKRRRQFLISTHNANIPVLADAELIVGLRAEGEPSGEGRASIPAESMGSIDARSVRELVEEILEGGKEAFERRRLKYGF